MEPVAHSGCIGSPTAPSRTVNPCMTSHAHCVLRLPAQLQGCGGDTRRRTIVRGELDRDVKGLWPSGRTRLTEEKQEELPETYKVTSRRRRPVHVSGQTVRNRTKRVAWGPALTAELTALALAFVQEHQSWQVRHWCPFKCNFIWAVCIETFIQTLVTLYPVPEGVQGGYEVDGQRVTLFPHLIVVQSDPLLPTSKKNKLIIVLLNTFQCYLLPCKIHFID